MMIVALGRPFLNYLRLASAILLPLSTRRTRVPTTATAFHYNSFGCGGSLSTGDPYSSCRPRGSSWISRRHYTTSSPGIVAPAHKGDDGGDGESQTNLTIGTRTNQLWSTNHSLQNGNLKYQLRHTIVFVEEEQEEEVNDATITTTMMGDDSMTKKTTKTNNKNVVSSIDNYSSTTTTGDVTEYYNPLTGVVTGQYRDTDHIEMLGLIGYDFIWADAEHSSASPDDIGRIILAAERRNIPTLVRVGYGYQNIIGHIQKYLVAGAQGIILPQCECKDDVLRIVDAVKFPPLGKRGLAGERWNAWGLARSSHQEENEQQEQLGAVGTLVSLAQCVEDANKNSIIGVVIESLKGIDALEDIVSVPELDFVFIAPTDLSADMGLHGQIRHPKVLAKIEEAGEIIYEANRKMYRAGRSSNNPNNGTIAAGTLAITPEDYMYWRERKFPVLCGVAQCMFVDGARGFLGKIQEYEQKHSDGAKRTGSR